MQNTITTNWYNVGLLAAGVVAGLHGQNLRAAGFSFTGGTTSGRQRAAGRGKGPAAGNKARPRRRNRGASQGTTT